MKSFRFDANFSIKFHVRKMMSWIVSYTNLKYDSFTVVKVRINVDRLFVESTGEYCTSGLQGLH